MADRMQLYYRHRQNGVTVFRLEVANRQRRIELNRIASLSRTGKITPHPRRVPSDAERDEIARWWQDWQDRRAAGSLGETERFVETLNHFTDWVARRADGAEIDARSDALLTALLDLRQVVVRRLSQIEPEGGPEDADEG